MTQIVPSPVVPGTCNQCLYWQPLEVAGYCHFSPPLVTDASSEGRAFWPRTLPTDWCGQWTQVPLERRTQVTDG